MPLQTQKLPRDITNALTLLFIEHPWLREKHTEAIELIDFCESLEEQQLLLTLLSKFSFLDPKKYQDALTCIANKIIDEWQLSEEETMLVAFSADEEADSGQVVLYELRTEVARKGWRKTKTVNKFGLAQRFVSSHPNVVLVDEFMGTGRTLIGRIQELHRHFEQKKIENYKIFPCVIAGMSFGLNRVREQTGYDVFSVTECKRGISELLAEEERERALELMAALESRLADCIGTYPLPKLGDGQSEALYARQMGNCPNSVFPVFWWPETKVSGERNTLLYRNLGSIGA